MGSSSHLRHGASSGRRQLAQDFLPASQQEVMAFLWIESATAASKSGRELACRLGRDDWVQLSMPEKGSCLDGSRVEAPRLGKGQSFIEHSRTTCPRLLGQIGIHQLPDGLLDRQMGESERTRRHQVVSEALASLLPPASSRGQEEGQPKGRRDGCGTEPKPADTKVRLCARTDEPPGGWAGEAERQHPVSEQESGGQSVSPACGPAEDGKPSQLELIRKDFEVICKVDYATAWEPIGAADTRAIGCDQPQSQAGGDPIVAMALQAGSCEGMEVDQGQAGGVPHIVIAEAPAIRQADAEESRRSASSVYRPSP